MAGRRIYKRDHLGRFDDVAGPGANAGKYVRGNQGGLGQYDANGAASMRAKFEAQVRRHNAAKAAAGGATQLAAKQAAAKQEAQRKRLASLAEANKPVRGSGKHAVKGRKVKK